MDHAMGGFNSSYALMYAQTDNTKPTISCHEAVHAAVMFTGLIEFSTSRHTYACLAATLPS
jgi:hypothetical protein